MTRYRNQLPQLEGIQFITDGGLETTLVFDENLDLPLFAAFPLIFEEAGRTILSRYYEPYIRLAREKRLGFVLESPTWRASRKWGALLGYYDSQIRFANIAAIEFLADLRDKFEESSLPIVISGCMGPRGDGYHVDDKMSIQEARAYHSVQIATFAETEADLVTAFTLNYAEEAIGLTLAAADFDIPAVISFTVETDGRLPSGQPLGSAICEVDRKTGYGPAYYMINCAHPSHFEAVLKNDESWRNRIYAIRANASCKSHAELDGATTLDRGNPDEFAEEYRTLTAMLPYLSVFGGCCGTDLHHITSICDVVTHERVAV